jgi:drug/metabolite transporter (DMT)-like permease
MIYLIFGIFTNAAIFLVFRAFSIFKIDNMQAIVFNYLFCVITALILIENPSVLTSANYLDSWSLVAAFIGILLVIGFYAASLTSQLLGVSVVSVASKMSMMFPVLFSLFFMKIAITAFTLWNYAGMLLALIAIYLSSVKRNSGESKSLHRKGYLLLLPFTVFLAGGLIDIGLNYSNHRLITAENVGVYTVVLFAGAAVSGIFSLFFQKGKFQLKNLLGGVVLGICNYLSLYFVLKALTAFDNNGAVFYPIYNVGIIMVASFTAMILFKEKLSKINFIGLTMAVLALFLLSYQDILDYFTA